jgi:hypothetical protein
MRRLHIIGKSKRGAEQSLGSKRDDLSIYTTMAVLGAKRLHYHSLHMSGDKRKAAHSMTECLQVEYVHSLSSLIANQC